ncbi:hypothetical protein F4778DRAFT_785366 [Xylariomycetidae sp. FL2044]|nr:hypothetical protein F4778DRAFT_785366 [Xylariomycetidae sp. FL2044]
MAWITPEPKDDYRDDRHEDSEYSLLGGYRKRLSVAKKPSWTFWVFCSVVLVVYTLSVLSIGYFIGIHRQHRGLVYSPAADGITMRVETIDTQFPTSNIYKGSPSPQLDEIWDSLTANVHVRISSEELARMNETSIALSDEDGGYLGGNWIRHVVYKDHYEEFPMAQMHIAHCIDSLRQTLMCQPNNALFMYDWAETLNGPVPRFVARRECVDWSKLVTWSASRRVSLYDTKALVHPVHGPSFPDGPEKTWEMLKQGNTTVN